ncbi:hypothetical protein FRC11_008045, partial [Ceratobasidium sp. 423]
MALYIQQAEAIEMHGTYLSELEENAWHAQEWGSRLESSHPEVEMSSEHDEIPELDHGYDKDEEDEWDVWYDEDDDEESPDELTDMGVRVKPMVSLEVGTQEVRPWEERTQPHGAEGSDVSPTFYPNPEHVLGKTPTATTTESELVLMHGTERFLDAIKLFFMKELPDNQQMLFDNRTRLNIWSRAHLFHSPPPFQPSEGQHVEVVCTQPAKVDQYGHDDMLMAAKYYCPCEKPVAKWCIGPAGLCTSCDSCALHYAKLQVLRHRAVAAAADEVPIIDIEVLKIATQ